MKGEYSRFYEEDKFTGVLGKIRACEKLDFWKLFNLLCHFKSTEVKDYDGGDDEFE